MAKSKNHTNANQCKVRVVRLIAHESTQKSLFTVHLLCGSYLGCGVLYLEIIAILFCSIIAFKAHRNGIKRPRRQRYPSLKGVGI